MSISRCFAYAAGAALAFAGHVQGVAAESQGWPTRAVTLVVPQAPGGGTDALARILAERLQSVFGQPFVVENKAGAGGNIGTAYVARQAADGYTLLLTTNTHVTNVSFYRQLPYDPVKDFEPISLIASIPFVMAVSSQSPITSVAELIAAAKARPGGLSYSSGGIGTPHHLGTELFKVRADVDMLHVPYKGSVPAATALLSNEVDVSISAVNSLLPHIRSGKLRPLAVATFERSPFVPELPTLAEAANIPGFGMDIWYAVLAPAGTPRAIIDRLSTEINASMRDPVMVAERITPQGLDAIGTTPEQLAEVIHDDLVKYQEVAKAAGIQPEI